MPSRELRLFSEGGSTMLCWWPKGGDIPEGDFAEGGLPSINHEGFDPPPPFDPFALLNFIDFTSSNEKQLESQLASIIDGQRVAIFRK